MTIGNMINTALLLAVLSILSIDYIGKVEIRAEQSLLIEETLNSFSDYLK